MRRCPYSTPVAAARAVVEAPGRTSTLLVGGGPAGDSLPSDPFHDPSSNVNRPGVPVAWKKTFHRQSVRAVRLLPGTIRNPNEVTNASTL